MSKREPGTIDGTVVPMFEVGAVVQVFVLAGAIPLDVWNGSVSADHA